MHSVHCQRNLVLCKLCDEPYPKDLIEVHRQKDHAAISCEKCGEVLESYKLCEHMVMYILDIKWVVKHQ